MAYPQANTYTKSSGSIIRLGSFAAENVFDSVSVVLDASPLPATVQNQIPVMSLHQSGADNYTAGRVYEAPVSGRMAYDIYDKFSFRTTGSTSGAWNGNKPVTYIRPNSFYGKYPNSSADRQGWSGFVFPESPYYKMITARRLDALCHWVRTTLGDPTNPSSVIMSKFCLTGGSMGAWGTMNFGVRNGDVFAALYPDRPRVHWDDKVGGVDYGKWDDKGINGSLTDNPQIDPEDGGGTVYDLHNSIAYVSNPGNRIPWIGWCIGENDTYMPFQDHIDFVAAMRAMGRPFAMAWNRGNHTTGQIMAKITATYPFGTFDLNEGYPHFTNHSRDIEPTIYNAADPSQPTEGGINLNLAFRNVIETETGWICEVTSTAVGVTTVDVRPYNSPVFKANVAPKTVTIPAANVWVAVSFSA